MAAKSTPSPSAGRRGVTYQRHTLLIMREDRDETSRLSSRGASGVRFTYKSYHTIPLPYNTIYYTKLYSTRHLSEVFVVFVRNGQWSTPHTTGCTIPILPLLNPAISCHSRTQSSVEIIDTITVAPRPFRIDVLYPRPAVGWP